MRTAVSERDVDAIRGIFAAFSRADESSIEEAVGLPEDEQSAPDAATALARS